MKCLRTIFIIAMALIVASMGVLAYTEYQMVGYNPGSFNVCAFGAVPNDGEDDTAAFLAMGSKEKAIYVPAGEFEVNQTIELLDSTLIGCGREKSVIICKNESDRDPIIEAGGRCVIRDLTIRYDDSCIKGNELAGERVGIYTGHAEKTLKRGTSITNINIENVGTGIYSPKLAITPETFKMYAVAFSVTFESVAVNDFIYRGFDMACDGRTGNIYRNIYISTNGKEANAGFYLQDSEIEADITDITIKNSKLKSPVKFQVCEALSVSNINIIDTELTKDNTGFVYFDMVNANVGSINIYNSAPKGRLQSFIRVGDNMYRGYAFDQMGTVHIGDMNIFNSDIDITPDAEQCFVARKTEYVNKFTVIIDRFNIVAPENIKAQYEQFKTNGRETELILGTK